MDLFPKRLQPIQVSLCKLVMKLTGPITRCLRSSRPFLENTAAVIR